MDTLFSAVYPAQWSSAAAPELHDELARCKAAGFKLLTVCPSADSLETDIMPLAKALIAYFKKFSEHPARRRKTR